MRPSHLRHLSLASLLLAVVTTVAQEPAAPKAPPATPKPTAVPEKPPPEPPRKVDPPAFPADGIYILAEQAGDLLRMIPRAVILKPAEYKRLIDEIQRLKDQLRPERAAHPGHCLLKGKIDGNAAQLQAQFKFTTVGPGAVVALACGKARATAATLDDQPAMLQADATDGFSVQVDKPGTHTLTLDLVAELAVRGGGRLLELDLPRAAITELKLELPAGARDVRLGTRALAESTGAKLAGNVLDANLGAIDRLAVGWKDASTPGGTTPLLTAEGRVLVRVDERQVTTTADLTLLAKGGPVKEWRLLVPAGAEIKPATADEARLQPLEKIDPQSRLRTLTLKEPSADPLKVTVTTRVALPRSGMRTPIGPFHVLGVALQTGTVNVTNVAADLRPHLLALLAPTEYGPVEDRDPSSVAAFRYQTPPPSTPPAAGAPLPGWFELEAESVRGLLETKVTHTLKLQRDATGRLVWRVITAVEATPIRAGVEHLEFQMPPDCLYDTARGPRPADLVREAENDPPTRLRFRLASEALKSFGLTFEAQYAQPVEETGRTTLVLPRPVDVRDRGGVVTIEAPEKIELAAPAGGNPTLDLSSLDPQKAVWRSDRLPERVEVAWRPYRPEVQVAAVADLTLSRRDGRVRHEFRLQFARTAPERLGLRVPAELADRLRVVAGGTLDRPDAPGLSARLVRLNNSAGKEHVLTLEYSFPLPESRPAGLISIPLVALDGSATGETKVRVWSDPASVPAPAGGPWVETNVEAVKDRPRLPALVLQSLRPDAPLSLRLSEAEGDAIAVLVERALLRVRLQEDGQTYHASFLLRQLASPYLDLDLPAPPLGLGLRVTLDGKDLDWEPSGQAQTIRLRLGPDLGSRVASLDVRYQLPLGRTGDGLVQSVLLPPVMRGAPSYVPTRWLIALAPGWVVLWPEGGPGVDRLWNRRGWQLVPRLTVTTNDLERWYAGADLPARGADSETALPVAHVCWRNGPAPLHIFHVPQRAWLLFCSLGFLVLGLVLDQLARPVIGSPLQSSPWFLSALALLALAAALVWLVYPTLLAAVLYGSQYGALVLGGYLLVQWVKHERYRRQVVFLSSFTRSRKGGSSMVRPGGSSIRPHGEPSTVDAPPPEAGAAVEEAP